ncbi:histone deacetylase 4 [Nephila pilipes]|uniref:Histone deacetylase n=1 Tax=Nephila pilipes TaxID=299642 RepID=A0A8X6QZ76_NEPPI|nr:histone deacetylase 4 [Nephila pilipes]
MGPEWREPIENLGHHNTMEINNHFNHLQRKEMSPSTFGSSPTLTNDSSEVSPAIHEQHLQFQHQLLQLKQQQQIQQQLLLQHFQQQQQQLAEQHEKQLQERIKACSLLSLRTWTTYPAHCPNLEYLDHQRKMEEEQKERRDMERLEQLKKKEKHEQSAIASSEVKQRLQEFVLNKKQREAAVNSTNKSPSNYRNWQVLGKYEDDFPLRKTASEPNLKVRSVLKQKVIDRRSSPLLRRKDKGPGPIKRRTPLSIENSKCDSTPGSSPPNGAPLQSMPGINGRSTIQEESPTSLYNSVSSQGSISDFTLYSSPSLPNISLGRPPVPTSTADIGKNGTPAGSDVQSRDISTIRLGMPLTSNVLHSLAYYPALPVIDGDFTPPTSPGYMQPTKILDGSTGLSGMLRVYPATITDAQVAQARLHRTIQRPLGRTQSAPLPLGHPMLQPQAILLSPQQNEQYAREKRLCEQQQHNLLKQHIRQTVLTRASSKNQVENVEEETEAAMAQEMKEAEQPEVIDLTDGRPKEFETPQQQRDREMFLQQHRDYMSKHTIQINDGTFMTRHHMGRPLSRTLSSPLVALSPIGSPQETQVPNAHTFTTGVVYDSLMLKHQCVCGNNSHHPEHGGRLQSIWARLQETGLINRCERVRSRKATLEELQSCHSENYTLLFGTNPLNRPKLDASKLADLPMKSFVMLQCGGIGVDSDTIWNDLHTASASRMAAGCVIELAMKVAAGEIKNGFAVVRPPGHHAEHQQAMGFCFFNSVAIAAKQLREKLKLEKILILDWDVHHGNGLQQIFYDDPHTLYISLHRHDDGNFFPGTGATEEVGTEDGIGFNINIAWSSGLNPPLGDAEYMAAFRSLIIPIIRDFDPEIILVAAGFDAACGHPAPLGGYRVSPACFGFMTQQLMHFAKGKIVLALEGGYDLPAICDSSQECVKALLGDECTPIKEEEMQRKPCQSALDVLQKTIAVQATHWPCIKRWAHTIGYSAVEAQQKEKEEVETVTALASLSMAVPHGHIQSPDEKENVEVEEPMEEDQEK